MMEMYPRKIQFYAFILPKGFGAAAAAAISAKTPFETAQMGDNEAIYNVKVHALHWAIDKKRPPGV